MYGENKAEVEEKLKSAASVSKYILSKNVVNTEVSEPKNYQLEATLAFSCTANDPLEEFKEFINCELLALTREFNANLIKPSNEIIQPLMRLNK